MEEHTSQKLTVENVLPNFSKKKNMKRRRKNMSLKIPTDGVIATKQ
jgi:hypothetical protein